VSEATEGRQDWLRDLSRGIHAARGIVEACEASCQYWHRVDRLSFGRIVAELYACLVVALASPGWRSINPPLPDEPAVPRHADASVFQVFNRGIEALIAEGERPIDAEQLGDSLLEKALGALEDATLFQCLYPDPEASPEFGLPARALFMLRKYVEGLHGILVATGGGEIGWTPHPLTRLVVNLQERISICVAALDNTELSGELHNLDGIVECLLTDSEGDFSVGWECGQAAEAAACLVAVEKAWLRSGSGAFDLTMAEQGFLGHVEAATSWYRERVKRQWKRILDSADRQAAVRTQESAGPRALAEYISQVELTLRNVVSTAYRARFGTKWIGEIRQTLDAQELQETEARLAREGQSDDDIMHMLNPGPLRQLVTRDWNVTGPCFAGAARKHVNALLDEWLKARTKVAHNRPPHLWPDIEQQRARVACHDLLDAIEPDLREPA